jgi:hypothetical protein
VPAPDEHDPGPYANSMPGSEVDIGPRNLQARITRSAEMRGMGRPTRNRDPRSFPHARKYMKHQPTDLPGSGLLSFCCEMKEVSGRPDPKHVSTSFVERQNWTVRGTMRRYTRLSNGFSRKLENHAAATALNYFAYNFIKIHRTLRTSPAMAAGVTDRLWSVEDLVTLWEAYEQRRRKERREN